MSDDTDDMTQTVVAIRGHKGGDIPDYHEGVWLGESVIRSRTGRRHRHGYTRFARVVCNNPGCEYEALVNAEAIAASAPDSGRHIGSSGDDQ